METNISQNKQNANIDKTFYFLAVFATKENQTLIAKLSILDIKKEVGKDKKEEEHQKPNFGRKFSKAKQNFNKSKQLANTPTKKSLLLAKSGQGTSTQKGKEWNKPKGFKSNGLERKQQQAPKKRVPYHVCPLGCRGKDNAIHKIKYGSLGFCPNFLNTPLAKREQILKDKPDILRCCLRGQNSPMGHQRGDKLNCRVKKCGACNRWGHSTLMCKDPAAEQIRSKQRKSIKMTHRKQVEEPDTEDEQQNDYPDEYEDPDEYDDPGEEQGSEEEEEENDLEDESEYDDSDYELSLIHI